MGLINQAPTEDRSIPPDWLIQALTEEELLEILENHLIPLYEATWKFLGQKLKIPKLFKKELVDHCVKRKTGARGLQVELCKYVEDELFDVELKLD